AGIGHRTALAPQYYRLKAWKSTDRAVVREADTGAGCGSFYEEAEAVDDRTRLDVGPNVVGENVSTVVRDVTGIEAPRWVRRAAVARGRRCPADQARAKCASGPKRCRRQGDDERGNAVSEELSPAFRHWSPPRPGPSISQGHSSVMLSWKAASKKLPADEHL